jgi:magnesium chelatase family protein
MPQIRSELSLAVLRSRALAGMEAPAVSVEVHLANGLPGLTKVGTNTPIITTCLGSIALRGAISFARVGEPASRTRLNVE